jgi:23S rRNA (adenine2503-C2)-methyltransferase
MITDYRHDLAEMELTELEQALESMGHPRFHGRQLFQWVHKRGVTDFGGMTDLGRELRSSLADQFRIVTPEVVRRERSTDGTTKFLLRLEDGQLIESVFIPDTPANTFCLSTQVGCAMRCGFCLTGKMGIIRNLTAGEIAGQVRVLVRELSMLQARFNIVLMGMGEPLYNYENVAKALKIIMDGEGIGLSRRRITLSTSGVVPMMDRCGAELGVNLAVSLHAVTDELRDRIVPLNRKYPIKELLDACRRYPGASNARRITFEYVMLKDVNDSEAEAHELIRLLRGLPAKVNLIPFNPWPGAPFETSTREKTQRFAEILNDAGYSSPIRRPRGRDILAACGQLKTEVERGRVA